MLNARSGFPGKISSALLSSGSISNILSYHNACIEAYVGSTRHLVRKSLHGTIDRDILISISVYTLISPIDGTMTLYPGVSSPYPMKMQNLPGMSDAVIVSTGFFNKVPGAPKGLKRFIENFNPKVVFGATPGSILLESVGRQL